MCREGEEMKTLRLGVAAVVVVVLAAGLLAAATPGNTAPGSCSASQLVPLAPEITVNQGLGNYAYLVRGKETLVKFFLTNPTSCSVASTQSINITGATLSVNNTVATVSGIGAFQSFGAAPPVTATVSTNSPADPVFVVPAEALAPAFADPSTQTFVPTFTATVTYSRKSGNTTTSGLTATFTKTGVTFDHQIRALRTLVVAMGDGSPGVLANTQFTSTDQTSTQNAFSALSRIFPSPSGIGGVDSSTGGIRYVIDTSALLNLRSVAGAYNSSNKFCGSGGNFDAIKAQLAQFMQSWNSNPLNAGKQVDRVLGVVGEGISDGAAAGCADGMASVISPEAWVRAISDKPAVGKTPAQPSRTGSLMAMELSHTWGGEPTATHHSTNVNADVTNPGRGYNVATRSFLSTNRSVMKYSFVTNPPWDDTLTLLEPADYAFDRCALGGTTVPDCALLGTTTGTTFGAAAGPSFIVSGTVNDSTNTAEIVQSGFLSSTPIGRDDNSVYRYVRRNSTNGALLTNIGFHVSFQNTNHNNGSDENGSPATHEGLFSFALDDDLPAPPADLAEVQLWRVSNPSPSYDPSEAAGDVLLYDKTQQSSPPQLLSISIGAAQQPTNFTNTPNQDETHPALSDSGKWIAWDEFNDDPDIDAQAIKVAPANDFSRAVYATRPTESNNDAENPAWNAAGTVLAFEFAGDIYTQTVDTSGAPATFGTPVKVYDSFSGEIQVPAHHPTWSRDGTEIAFESQGDIWKMPAEGGTPTNLTNTPDDFEHDPSWSHTSGDNRIAYVQDEPGCEFDCGQVFVLDPASPSTTQDFVTGGDEPSFGTDGRIAFHDESDGNIYDIKPGDESPVQISTGGSDSAPSTAAGLFAFERTFSTLSCGGDVCFTLSQIDIMLTRITGIQSVTFRASSTATLKGELVHECGGVAYPVHVGLDPDAFTQTAQIFNTNFDGSNACSGGLLRALVTDGVQYNTATGGGGGTLFVTPEVDAKPPTAAIFTPLDQTYPAGATFAVSGTGYDAEGRVLPATGLHWTLTLPNGTVQDLGSFAAKDFKATLPAGWPGGTLRFTLVATDGSGTPSPPVTRDVHVLYDFVGGAFLPPLLNPPGVNIAKPGTQFPIKWQLKDASGNYINDLGTVQEVAYASDGTPPTCNFNNTKGPFIPLPTGGTVLRYDSKNNQFVYNWTTPSTRGCYVFQLTLADATTHQAWFNLS